MAYRNERAPGTGRGEGLRASADGTNCTPPARSELSDSAYHEAQRASNRLLGEREVRAQAGRDAALRRLREAEEEAAKCRSDTKARDGECEQARGAAPCDDLPPLSAYAAWEPYEAAQEGTKAPPQGDPDQGNGAAAGAATPSAAAGWPEPLDLAALAKAEPQAPRMLIDGWLPCGYATLMAGHGGVGKSGIALRLAVCAALGRPFFGLEVQQCRVLYLACEDRERVLHWRLHLICAHMGIDLGALHGRLDAIDLVGHETVLWERDPRTGEPLTPAYSCLRSRMQKGGHQLLIVDGISDTYGGNENARGEVKRYVNGLVALVPEDTGAVLLTGHINRPTASGVPTSEGYSGSTGWHNAVRARWYLY